MDNNLTVLSELTNLSYLAINFLAMMSNIQLAVPWPNSSVACNMRILGSGNKISPSSVKLAPLSTSNTESILEELHVACSCMFPTVPVWTAQHEELCLLGIAVEKLMEEDVDAKVPMVMDTKIPVNKDCHP